MLGTVQSRRRRRDGLLDDAGRPLVGLAQYLEELKNRSELRMLFSVSKNATREDVMRAVAIIEALKKEEEGRS